MQKRNKEMKENENMRWCILSDRGIIIGLERNIRRLETKIDQLEKVLCPECKKKFAEIFRNN